MSRTAKKTVTLLNVSVDRAGRVSGHRVGRIVDVDNRGLLVDYAGNPHGPLVARQILQTAPGAAMQKDSDVLLVFEDERSDLPIVVGVVVPGGKARVPSGPGVPSSKPIEALVDGTRVVLEAADEIVLRCGHASITLRKNGRLIVRGTYVETRSQGVNRIKGGSVQIN